MDPQRWNRYAYVRNNPLRYVDPDGRMIWGLLDIGLTFNDIRDTYATWTSPTASNWDRAAAVVGTVIGAVAPGGGYGAVLTKVDDAVVRGYRAVSRAEADDIAKNGYRQMPNGNSMEDKWFSSTREGADQMRAKLKADVVVEADVPRAVYDRSHKASNIDRTGPGFCVSCSDLGQIKPRPQD